MSLDIAVEAIRQGLVVGVPTDTVYGIAADPFNDNSVQALFDLKGRSYNKPIPLLASSIAELVDLVELPPVAEDLAERHWPGPLTIVVNVVRNFARGVGDSSRGTVAIRVPDQQMALDLLARTGPLAVTSANTSGVAPSIDEFGAKRQLGEGVAVYLSGHCPRGNPSTIIDVTVDPPKVLRSGPIMFDL